MRREKQRKKYVILERNDQLSQKLLQRQVSLKSKTLTQFLQDVGHGNLAKSVSGGWWM